MSFKFYHNKKTKHPSISIKQRDKKRWRNLSISHFKPQGDSYIEINDPHPRAKKKDKSYVRKYVRNDKPGVRGHRFREYKLNTESESKIKEYLIEKYKKR